MTILINIKLHYTFFQTLQQRPISGKIISNEVETESAQTTSTPELFTTEEIISDVDFNNEITISRQVPSLEFSLPVLDDSSDNLEPVTEAFETLPEINEIAFPQAKSFPLESRLESPISEYLPPINEYLPPINEYLPPVNEYLPPNSK